ncbi:hypothetical protein D3C86_1387700 [compost metagenome]
MRPRPRTGIRPQPKPIQTRIFARAHQPRGQGAHARADREGGFGRGPRNLGSRGKSLRSHHRGGRASCRVNQGSRSGQGNREHPTGLEHCLDERVGLDLRSYRHSHQGCPSRRGDEVELPALHPGTRRGTLHRSGSVLPHHEGRGARLQSPGHSGGPPYQRRNGSLCRPEAR